MQSEVAETETYWFALKTRSRHEKVVHAALLDRGFESFLPLLRERRRWQDRFKIVELPLFSTYLFVRLNPVDRWQLLKTRGVVGLVASDVGPVPVAESEIASLRKLENGDGPVERHAFVREGERVRVRSGPLRGLEGVVVRTAGKTRVVVSIDLFQQAAAVTLDEGDLEALA